MKSSLSNSKARNAQAKMRFTCDLLTSINKKQGFDSGIQLGFGLNFDDVLQNIVIGKDSRNVEFAGVILQHQSSGTVLFKAHYIDDVTGKPLSKTYSIKNHGIKVAFLNAVKRRAEFCGYSGPLPVEHLYIPSPDELLSLSVITKGNAWVEEKGIKALLQNNL
ncbi:MULTISPECIES: hypothetical protein [Pseudoalteromonas]|uniref:hypothetical protein n=1 Tax=Pseudoalteromonas TaxID=53246 RepID=UPI001021A322|nr:hypothetical protein [Pseudoalteromonas sp. MEBiC 03485]RZD19731.1 hypothetical protein EVU92_21245 [Pseudoalteromonas sp. MEBiC 03485]